MASVTRVPTGANPHTRAPFAAPFPPNVPFALSTILIRVVEVEGVWVSVLLVNATLSMYCHVVPPHERITCIPHGQLFCLPLIGKRTVPVQRIREVSGMYECHCQMRNSLCRSACSACSAYPMQPHREGLLEGRAMDPRWLPKA